MIRSQMIKNLTTGNHKAVNPIGIFTNVDMNSQSVYKRIKISLCGGIYEINIDFIVFSCVFYY